MSGGSMDYLYIKVNDEAQNLLCSRDPERRAFGRHLELVAKALHDIEWVQSGDYGPGDDSETIRACLSSGAALAELIRQGEETIAALRAEIATATGAGEATREEKEDE